MEAQRGMTWPSLELTKIPLATYSMIRGELRRPLGEFGVGKETAQLPSPAKHAQRQGTSSHQEPPKVIF